MKNHSAAAAHSWKAQAGGDDRSRGRGPKWRSEQEPLLLARRRTPWRWGRIFVVFTLFALLSGVFIWVSLWLRPARDTSVIVMGAAYQENLGLPHNVYGWNGLLQLADLTRNAGAVSWNGGNMHLLGDPHEIKSAAGWDADLHRFPGRTLLLYLSLHGGADRQGGYLLAQNAFLEDSEEHLESAKIRLRDILAQLKSVPHSRNVVLVLETAHMTSNWQLGMLHNEFARELDQLSADIEAIPNLVVIGASSENQKVWPSPTLKQTAFSHYFVEGLKGAADSSPYDNKVNLLELYSYVKKNVDRWAQVNRDASQTPVLYPVGKTGRDRAARIHLNLVRNYAPPEARNWKSFTPPADLEEAWKRFADLEQSLPAPTVYTPQLWRLYQDWLLRYEELVEAEGSSAPAVRQRLRDLEQAILQARFANLGSDEATLPMFVASGRTIGKSPAAAILQQLWDGPAEKKPHLWRTVHSQMDPAEFALLRMQVCEWALDRAADDPDNNLEKASQVLVLLDDPLQVRPAENHFFFMLRRDMPGLAPVSGDERSAASAPTSPAPAAFLQPPRSVVPPAELIRLALRVRLRAERALLGLTDGPWSLGRERYPYPYAEQLYPWIRTWIEPADTLRQRGQDLLFAGGQANWDKARDLLLQAHQLYAKAQDNALRVRTALDVRNSVWPALPYLCRWSGARLRTRDAERATDAFLLPAKLEVLCRDVHHLADALARPEPDACAPLAKQAEQLWRTFQDMQADARLARLRLDETDAPGVWRQFDAALHMPFADVKLRLEMLGKRSRIGLHLQVGMAANAAAADAPSPPPETIAGSFNKAYAHDEGRLALALLGAKWFNDCGADLETFDQVQHRLERFLVEEKWWESLTVAGEEIAQRWCRLPGAIAQNLHAAVEDPARAMPLTAQADRYNRMLDGPGAGVVQANASTACRFRALAQLLQCQARRAFQDHWYSEDPGKEPYYRLAAASFLADLRTLTDKKSMTTEPTLLELIKDLQEPSAFRLLPLSPDLSPQTAVPSSLPVTSASAFDLRYKLLAPRLDLDLGIPVIWAEPGQHLLLTGADKPGRQPQDFAKTQEAQLGWQLVSPLLQRSEKDPPRSAGRVDSSFTVRGYYRGQPLSLVTPLALYPLATTVLVEHPLPVKASVAVRASKDVHRQYGQGAGALVIVLDCSGSMGPPQGQPFGKNTKFAEATAALRSMLRKIPQGTVVSLWAFGQAMGAEMTVTQAERTIQPILAPTTWEAGNPELLRLVMARVEYPALRPWNQSPIIRAMTTAMRQDLQNTPGFKSMVVITDGMDNRFDKDAELNPKGLDPRTFIRENFQDVEVNIIGFKIANQEEEAARKQFQVIEELPLPGKFYSVQESQELARTLENVLRQKLRFWVDRPDDRPVPGFGEVGLDVSTGGGSDQWLPGGLLPGPYKVRVHTNQRLTKNIALNRADLLLIELTRSPGLPPGVLDFQRVIYSLADFPWKPAREKGNWRLAALQNQRVDDRGLRMLATLERKNDPLALTLQQANPAKVWFEIAPPADIKTPLHCRWQYQPGYPAPAWSFDMPLWPARPGGSTPVRPVLRAWWSPDQKPVPLTWLEKDHDFQSPLDLRNRPVLLGETSGMVESVQVEDHLVEVQPASRNQVARRERKTCLVVRLHYPAGKPCWVTLPGLDTVGAEHQFFAEANRYTGIFWPVTRDQIALSLTKIEIHALDAFKKEAESRQCFMELDNLYEPQANDNPPLSPTDLAPMETSLAPLDSIVSPYLLPVPLARKTPTSSTTTLPPWFIPGSSAPKR